MRRRCPVSRCAGWCAGQPGTSVKPAPSKGRALGRTVKERPFFFFFFFLSIFFFMVDRALNGCCGAPLIFLNFYELFQFTRGGVYLVPLFGTYFSSFGLLVPAQVLPGDLLVREGNTS